MADAVRDQLELLLHRQLGRELARQLLLAGAQHVDREAAGVAHDAQRAGAVVEAHQHQQRVQRQRADGVGGHAHGTAPVQPRDHRHSGREVAHHGPKALPVALHLGAGVLRRLSAPMTRRGCALGFTVLACAASLSACGSQGIALDEADRSNASLQQRRRAVRPALRWLPHAGGGRHRGVGVVDQGPGARRRAQLQRARGGVRRRCCTRSERRLLGGDHAPEHRRSATTPVTWPRFLAKYAGRDAVAPKAPTPQVQPTRRDSARERREREPADGRAADRRAVTPTSR